MPQLSFQTLWKMPKVLERCVNGFGFGLGMGIAFQILPRQSTQIIVPPSSNTHKSSYENQHKNPINSN